jgi:hypothetical protein
MTSNHPGEITKYVHIENETACKFLLKLAAPFGFALEGLPGVLPLNQATVSGPGT